MLCINPENVPWGAVDVQEDSWCWMIKDSLALRAVSCLRCLDGDSGRGSCPLQPCRRGLMGSTSLFRADQGRIMRRAALGKGVRRKLVSPLHPASGGAWGEWRAPHREPVTHCLLRSGLCCQEENHARRWPRASLPLEAPTLWLLGRVVRGRQQSRCLLAGSDHYCCSKTRCVMGTVAERAMAVVEKDVATS